MALLEVLEIPYKQDANRSFLAEASVAKYTIILSMTRRGEQRGLPVSRAAIGRNANIHEGLMIHLPAKLGLVFTKCK